MILVCEYQYTHFRAAATWIQGREPWHLFRVLGKSNSVRTHKLLSLNGVGRISTSLEQRSLGTWKMPCQVSAYCGHTAE